MKPIADFVRTHPDIARYQTKIIEAVNAARLDLVRRIADEAERDLKTDHVLSFLKNKPCFDEKGNGAFVLQSAAGHILAAAPFRIVLQYWTEQQVFLAGTRAEEDEISQHRSLFVAMNAWMVNYAKEHDYHQAGANEERNWPLGWHDLLVLGEDAILADALEEPASASAGRLCTGVREYELLVEQAYRSAQAAVSSHSSGSASASPLKLTL